MIIHSLGCPRGRPQNEDMAAFTSHTDMKKGRRKAKPKESAGGRHWTPRVARCGRKRNVIGIFAGLEAKTKAKEWPTMERGTLPIASDVFRDTR